MPEAQPVLRFHSDALPGDDLVLTRLEGEERISRPYRFELELVSARADLAIGPILRKPAWVGIEQGVLSSDGELVLDLPLRLHGRIPTFEQIEKRDDAIVYKAVLVPRLWKLSLTYQSRIFLGKTVPQIVEAVLQGAGFAKGDYELDLAKPGGYAVRDYVVQYEESDLDFLSRWLEHEGIFYFFRQGEDGESIVFADSVNSYAAFRANDTIRFLSDPGKVAGQEVEKTWFREESVQAFSCRFATIPRKVVLKDYNWRTPGLDLRCSADVDPEGEGTVYEYNNHFKTPEEGNALARLRAEEIRCGSVTFRGSGDCRAFRAGATWRIAEHFRDEFNAPYLLTEVRHRATQPAQISALRETRATYTNDFVCIPVDRVFRPARGTPWPAIHGAMHAKIDGATDGTYAEIDGEGRYKVKLPLDLSDATGGHASRYVRMAQPYAGSDHGMHFPLHKGTEVLLTHIDGDPDRPIITGAVPNAEAGSVINSANHTKAGIRTAGGNQVAIDDAAGHEKIYLRAGSGKSHIVVGSGSDDRCECSSPSTAMWGSIANFAGSLISYSGMAGANVSFTAGNYPLTILSGAIKCGADIGNAWLKPSTESWPPPWGTVMTASITILSKIINSLLLGKWLKSSIEAIAARSSIATRPSPWMGYLSALSSKISGYISGASATGFGAYLIRAESGARLQLDREGPSVFIGSEKGSVVLSAAMNLLADADVTHIRGKELASLKTNKGGLDISTAPDALFLHYDADGMQINAKTLEMQHRKRVLIGAGPTNLLRMSGEPKVKLGEENYLEIDDGKGSASMSGKSDAGLYSGPMGVQVSPSQVALLNDGDDPTCGIQIKDDGSLKIFAKKLEVYADEICLGEESTKLTLAGSKVEIKSGGALNLTSGQAAQLNGQNLMVQPPPVPLPPPPPISRRQNIVNGFRRFFKGFV